MLMRYLKASNLIGCGGEPQPIINWQGMCGGACMEACVGGACTEACMGGAHAEALVGGACLCLRSPFIHHT